jgi:pimeloyl-ACP methyl ester carboxylesterase
MEKVASPDGTPIAFFRSGSGQPLILVHGSGAANAAAWTAFPALKEHFNVVVVDRCGRGESGDHPAYAIQREYEDIAAVADALGEPANLLGHSFGGLCALEAALLTRNIRKLILYELAMPFPGQPIYPTGVIDRMQARLDAGDRAGVLTILYREVAKMSPAEFDQFRSSPAWPVRVASAHTVPREARAEEGYPFDGRRFKDLHTPTLLLTGEDSPPHFKQASQTLASALPACRTAIMPGQEHIAMYTAPDVFVREVADFLKE